MVDGDCVFGCCACVWIAFWITGVAAVAVGGFAIFVDQERSLFFRGAVGKLIQRRLDGATGCASPFVDPQITCNSYMRLLG